MEPAKKVIERLGGASRLAERLGYGKGGAQRVHNWMTRGIPAKVILDNPDIFQSAPQDNRNVTG